MRKPQLLTCAAPALAVLIATDQHPVEAQEPLPISHHILELAVISTDPVRTPSADLKFISVPSPGPADQLDPVIREASRRFSIPEEWIRSVIRIESGAYLPEFERPLVSSAGAIGVMQLMRNTYNDMRLRHDLGPDPSNIRDNVLAGNAYLRELYKRYGYPGLFGAYNAGPARMENYLKEGTPLPLETVVYIRLVTSRIRGASVAD